MAALCAALLAALVVSAPLVAGVADIPVRSAAEAALNDRQAVMSAHPKSFDPAVDTWMEQVGDKPLVFYFHNFLSDAERKHMLRTAAPQMKRSTVVGAHGESVVDNIRTSYGMFIRRMQDAVIERIEARISLWTQTPLSHQEDIQVLRYTKGQKYGAHYDSSYANEAEGPHHRLYTFYMYLSDVEEGGETAFPEKSAWTDPGLADALKGNGWSDCAKGNVAAKPKAGDAALFYSFFRNGTMDAASMHTGCPVIKGIKWGAPTWVHVDEFRPLELRSLGNGRYLPKLKEPGMCMDVHAECPKWAAAGECERNPGFMKGDTFNQGACRKACKFCEDCDQYDMACINRNRVKAGYLELDRKEMEWLGIDLWSEAEAAAEAAAAIKADETIH